MNDPLIHDEYDILNEIQSRAIYLIDSIKETLKKKKLNVIDKEIIVSQIYMETNNILNKAFNNRSFFNYLDIENSKTKRLPDHYFKPDKNYMDLLKIAYSMNDQQFDLLLKSANEIRNTMK